MIFGAKYVFTMVFGGSILGCARKIWGNPYLNSTTVLFDMGEVVKHKSTRKRVLSSDDDEEEANTIPISPTS